ncbi:MAG: GntR family transcriptional regulator [Burkholderiaceae bacterium]
MSEVLEIARPALHDQVAQRLRSQLVEGAIAPGEKLNERALCEKLGVSRTPLREAIKLLAAEGLVDLVPNRGAVAVSLTESDVLHSFEVLATLEAMAGELAAQRISTAERTELTALHHEMKACYVRRDLSGYYRLNAHIHELINESARNPVLTTAYKSINARVQALRFRTNQNETKWQRAIRDHDLMIEALEARDAAGLRSILMAHLNNKRDTILDLMRAGELYPRAVAG